MDIALKPELQKYVDDQVKAGHFESAAEVVEAGLARLMLDPVEDDLDAETLAAIEEGEAQLDRGEGIPLDEAFRQLRARLPGE